MMVRTLEEIRAQRGPGIHGFVLMVTGALPADPDAAKQMCSMIHSLVDKVMVDIEVATEGEVEVTSASLRMETSEAYIKLGLPNARK